MMFTVEKISYLGRRKQREGGVVEKKQRWTRAKGYKGINIS
jgi:hypothetical protein